MSENTETTPKNTQEATENTELNHLVEGIISDKIEEIATKVHEVGISRGMGIKIAKDEMEKQQTEITDKYDILFNYFASWILSGSKDNRRLFVMLNLQEAFNQSLLSLLCKFFGYKNAGESFIQLYEQCLDEILKKYEAETGMIAAEDGLRHNPQKA
jgi:hypothetical protein